MKKAIGAAVLALSVFSAGVSAQGAVIDITGAEINSNGYVDVNVSVTEPEDNMQYTMLVLKAASDGSYTLDNIVYLNQLNKGEYNEADEGISFTMAFAAESGESYLVKVGGTAVSEPDSYEFGEEGGDVMYGDADSNGILTANDSAEALMKALNSEYKAKAELKVIDVNGNGEVDAGDSAEILSKVLNSAYKFGVEE
ncbi:MAG: hypothetical protein LIO44_05310 [Eubacterium sp.]|nr:hypothetical protein [Eubacterium sp.]